MSSFEPSSPLNGKAGGYQVQADFPKASPPLEEAFRRWQDELLGSLYILLGSIPEAQEAFREVFLRCWRHREQLAGLEDRKGWIFQAAFQTARQRRAAAWRRRWRLWNWEQSDSHGGESPDGVNRPEDFFSEKVELYRRALMELAPEEQEVFLLRQNGQMDYEQIAALLRVPVGVVKAHMRRALAQLLQTISTRNLFTDPGVASEGCREVRENEGVHPVLPFFSRSASSPGQEGDSAKTSVVPILPM